VHGTIRNLAPDREHHTHIDRAEAGDGKDYGSTWERHAASDAVAAAKVRRCHMRPAEALYDLAADPREQNNLAADPACAMELAERRRALDASLRASGDEGLAAENARRPRPRGAKP
jgi:hypothetical protein